MLNNCVQIIGFDSFEKNVTYKLFANKSYKSKQNFALNNHPKLIYH